jgi:uncharacterized protein
MKVVKALVAALLFLPVVAAAMPEIPPLTGRVVDRAGVFGENGIAKIEGAIMELEAVSGGQMAVLTVKTLDRTPIEEFGIAVMDKWKIGHKGKDNGAILILAVEDREMRLEVGYGWEGDINDARVGDILRAMAPFLRDGCHADAAAYAIGEVQLHVTGQAPKGHQSVSREEEPDIGIVVLLVILVLVFLAFGKHGRSGRGGGFFIGGGGFGGGGGGFSGGGGGGGGGGASGRW